MLIEIHIPRPLTVLLAVFACTGWVLWLTGSSVPTSPQANMLASSASSAGLSQAVGGTGTDSAVEVVEAEQEVFFARKTKEVIAKKEDLLRYQLKILEEEQTLLGEDIDETVEAQFIAARTNLVKLLQDKNAAEMQIKNAMQQLWNARIQGSEVSVLSTGETPVLAWPVEPSYGVSAQFRDPEYEKLFGFVHDGIDIPALQGTEILAPAAGVVEKVANNGYGYSYIIIRHKGIATLYGHVSALYVAEGAQVNAGDTIGLTGGRPGTLGAGSNTTGPHLHFEVIQNGKRIDPLTVLESHPEVQ